MPSRILGIIIMALAVPIMVVPQFTNCSADGQLLTLANGKTTPMKCLWTARAEIAVGAPLFLVGGMLALSKRKETRRGFSLAAGTLGLFAMLLPTALIGVCANQAHNCNAIMLPTLMLLGGFTIGASVLSLAYSEFFSGRGPKPTVPAAA